MKAIKTAIWVIFFHESHPKQIRGSIEAKLADCNVSLILEQFC